MPSVTGARRAAFALLAACLAALGSAPPANAAADKLRPYKTEGTTTSGGSNAVDAPLLEPGLYRDALDTADEDSSDTDAGNYYKFRLRTGDTPYVSATEIPPARKDDKTSSSLALEMSLKPVDRSHPACSFTETGSDQTADGKLNTVTAVIAEGPVGGPDWDDDCPTDADYALQVVRTGDAYAGTSMPVEIAFHAEPSATTAGVPAAAAERANIQATATSAKTVMIPKDIATSFNDAPLLTSGQYRDTFYTGETRYYRIHLDWGQRFAYTLTADQDPDVKDLDGSQGHTTIVNSLRHMVAQPERADTDEDYLGSTGKPMSGSTLVPARYTNRGSEDDRIKGYAIDGDYYLALSTDFPDSNEKAITVGYSLVIDVVGAKERGPVYSRGGPLPSGSAGSSGVSTPVIVAAALGGGLVLVALVAVAVELARRRRRRRAVSAGPLGAPGAPGIVAHRLPIERRR